MGPDSVPIATVQNNTFWDHVTAHKVALMVLVKEFCVVKNKCRASGTFQSEEGDSWTHSNQQQRDFAITILKLIQSTDMELKQLITILKPVLHPKTNQMFLDKLKELRTQGVAGIMDYVQTLETLLVDPQHSVPIVHKSSVLGLFIRRMLLAFDKLSFSHVTKLYHKYCAYCNAAFKMIADDSSCSSEVAALTGVMKDISDYSDSEDRHVHASQKQAEFFIAQQAALLQINEKQALLPRQLQDRIRELLKGNPELSEAHYLSFLNSLRVKEYCGAIENLYHHFDRNTSIPQDSKVAPVAEESTRSFRYAALNLAILHAHFGHREEALAALKEAIMVSQEVNDNICLQHALSWLYQLTPENVDTLVEHSVSKSAELNLWYLSSLGVQSLTKLKALTSAEPAQVFEVMMKGDILNCQHSMTELMGAAYAQRAALWALYGNNSMSTLISQLLLLLNTSDPIRGGVYHVGEGVCIALRNLAWSYASQGEYFSASEVLKHAKEMFPVQTEYSSIWMLCEQTIQFEKSLYSGKWQNAEKAMAGIAIIDQQEAKYRKAQLLLQQGNNSAAHEVIKSLLDDCQQSQSSSTHFLVRVLLLEAELLCQSSNYGMAIPALTRSIALCKEHHLLYLKALSVLHLASVQFMLGLPNQALSLLDTVFITILSHGSQYDKACVYLLYAKCSVVSVKFGTSERDKKEVFLSSVAMVMKAVEHFQSIEAFHRTKDAIYWQACLYHKLGLNCERNQCARQFRLLDQQLGSNSWNGVFVP